MFADFKKGKNKEGKNIKYKTRYKVARMIGYNSKTSRKLAKKGCYIATSIYGSYDCLEVWTLRRYRDYKLSKKIFDN